MTAGTTVRDGMTAAGTIVRDGLLVASCACGGELIAVRSLPDELRNAVAFHNAKPEHAAWRQRRAGLGDPGELIGIEVLRRGGRPLRADAILELVVGRAGS